MDRQTFLEQLRKALYGRIDERDLSEHMRYYETYIAKETAGGRPEREVLEELGDPRLLARTILETSGQRTVRRGYTVTEDGEADGPSGYRVHVLDGWKAKLIAAGFFAAVFLLLVLVFHVVAALLPVLIVLGVIGWLIQKTRQ